MSAAFLVAFVVLYAVALATVLSVAVHGVPSSWRRRP